MVGYLLTVPCNIALLLLLLYVALQFLWSPPSSRDLIFFLGNPGIQIDKDKLQQQDGSQQVAYYLVALGSDRRFNHTRDNVVPYTNVGTNTSVTFYDLDLTPGIAVYYFSVYAVSKSFSRTLVTSNGFYVGFDGGVTGKGLMGQGASFWVYLILFSECGFLGVFLGVRSVYENSN